MGSGMISIGTAPDSWGVWFPDDSRQMPWQRAMDEMAEAGYTGVELGPWGYFPNERASLQSALDERGLSLVATTAGANFADDDSVAGLIATIDEICPLQLTFPGARFVVLLPQMYTDLMDGSQVLPATLTTAQLDRLYANIQRVSDYVRETYGLTAALHPHVECHIETEAEIEGVLENTTVALCLDTGHHVYGGGEPISFYNKHADRIPYIHVKDCDTEVQQRMRENGWSFAQAVKHDIMCEPGSGGIDFHRLFTAMRQNGYDGWVVVEHDLYPAPFDRPLPIARRTREFLLQCLV